MSRAAKTTFAVTSTVTAGIVLFVHYNQRAEQKAMHAGVIRDDERQRLKRERAADFAMSAKLKEEYEKIQPVTKKVTGFDGGDAK